MNKGINIVCNCPKNCEKNDRRIAFINEANRGGLIFLASLFSLLLLVQLSKWERGDTDARHGVESTCFITDTDIKIYYSLASKTNSITK